MEGLREWGGVACSQRGDWYGEDFRMGLSPVVHREGEVLVARPLGEGGGKSNEGVE